MIRSLGARLRRWAGLGRGLSGRACRWSLRGRVVAVVVKECRCALMLCFCVCVCRVCVSCGACGVRAVNVRCIARPRMRKRARAGSLNVAEAVARARRVCMARDLLKTVFLIRSISPRRLHGAIEAIWVRQVRSRCLDRLTCSAQ